MTSACHQIQTSPWLRCSFFRYVVLSNLFVTDPRRRFFCQRTSPQLMWWCYSPCFPRYAYFSWILTWYFSFVKRWLLSLLFVFLPASCTSLLLLALLLSFFFLLASLLLLVISIILGNFISLGLHPFLIQSRCMLRPIAHLQRIYAKRLCGIANITYYSSSRFFLLVV